MSIGPCGGNLLTCSTQLAEMCSSVPASDCRIQRWNINKEYTSDVIPASFLLSVFVFLLSS